MSEIVTSAPSAAAAPPLDVSTVVVGLAAGALFVLPALWNGFPLVFYDTGGYLAAVADGELSFGRSAAYGALLTAGLPLAFWPAILIQAGVAAWVVLATLRAHGIVRPAVTAAILVFVAATTSLPWYAAQLMPDLWASLAVLALYLLAFRPPSSRAERIGLAVVIAFAITAHMAILALALGLATALAVTRLVAGRLGIERPSLTAPVLAVLAGIIAAPASNAAITGHFAFTPGGSNFLFARLVHTGIAARYLADHCPDPSLEICKFRLDIPPLGEDWLWEPDSPFNYALGSWAGFGPEARRIVVDSLSDYPLDHLAAAVAGAAEQFVTLQSGEGLGPWTWHTQYLIERLAPDLVPVYKAARQQQDGIDLTLLNVLHVPVAFLSLLGLPVVVLAARRRRLPASTATLCGFVLVALLGNAAICGALSIPHARYQSRIVWLAPFAIAIVVAGRCRRAGTPPPLIHA
jgi:hypothetical protein